MSDLISRQSAINALYHHFPHMTREECAAILHEVGSDREEQTRGKWMLYQKGPRVTGYKCSECGRVVYNDTGYDVAKDFPFCNCGADMRGNQE